MSEGEIKYASNFFDSPLGFLVGAAMVVAGGGIGFGAGYFGYNQPYKIEVPAGKKK